MNAIPPILLAAVTSLCASTPPADSAKPMIRTIQLTDRLLYGPGPMPDQHLAKGHVHNMEFVGFMRATVPGTNNGGAEPNVSGEALQGGKIDGALSDGTKINENIDMGQAVLLNGQFKLLLAATHGGPHQGNSEFLLDQDLNWTIHDDIAIDPGFAEGVIKLQQFRFTSGPTFVPYSLQSQRKQGGGVDRVGSLRSGEVIFGRVGDDDFDGFVDGVWIAAGNFPFDAMMLPGAPFVQRLEFTSDVAIEAMDAAMLSLAAARNRLKFVLEQKLQDKVDVAKLVEGARHAQQLSLQHLDRALAGPCAADVQQIRDRLAQLQIAEGVDAAARGAAALEKLVSQLVRVHETRQGTLKRSRL